MSLFSRRLPHVVTRADLVTIVAPTYAASLGVDEEEARERLVRAVEHAELADLLYEALSSGLRARQGPRMTEDALVDKLSKGVATRRGRVKAAPSTPGVSAVLVRVNLELGLAPEGMRATLASDRGRAVLDAGVRELGAHLVKELLR